MCDGQNIDLHKEFNSELEKRLHKIIMLCQKADYWQALHGFDFTS